MRPARGLPLDELEIFDQVCPIKLQKDLFLPLGCPAIFQAERAGLAESDATATA